jgi:hypothetical protein
MEHQEASTRLDEAATKAFELIQEYAEVNDPHSEQEDNPWRNPEAIYKALDQARLELNQAWKEQQQSQPKSVAVVAAGEETKTEDIEEFRALYMDMITDAFSDVLENMRERPEEDIDVDVLVDCLQSGMDMLSSEERDGFFQALDDDDDDDDLDDDETPHHELHRRELGLDVSVASF